MEKKKFLVLLSISNNYWRSQPWSPGQFPLKYIKNDKSNGVEETAFRHFYPIDWLDFLFGASEGTLPRMRPDPIVFPGKKHDHWLTLE